MKLVYLRGDTSCTKETTSISRYDIPRELISEKKPQKDGIVGVNEVFEVQFTVAKCEANQYKFRVYVKLMV